MNKLATLVFLLISAVAVAVMLAPAARGAIGQAAAPAPDKTIYPKLYTTSDPYKPVDVMYDGDGSMRVVRGPLITIPFGQTNMIGFRTYPVPISAGTKSVTISVTFAVSGAPVSPAYRLPGTCVLQAASKELLSGESQMLARRAPTYGDQGPRAMESFRVTVPARDFGSHVPQLLLKVFYQHQPNKKSCRDLTTVVAKEFKIIFHSTEQPAWYGKLMAMGDTGHAVSEDDFDDEDTFDEYGGAYSLVDEAFGDDEDTFDEYGGAHSLVDEAFGDDEYVGYEE
ncbi:hypothetical protein GGF31_005654 [Allomyces arbusculus]|nr:hypothetical protein GGF31_005654 [Allomyces arbusculus]